ncbi:MAG: hypothetical protein EBV30_10560 [Actinobacteria bacterium]|nr:hypothetical protein [Actinomycetota bacterium]NBO55887.1 hypothetical protein [Actinomycetota bacterium]
MLNKHFMVDIETTGVNPITDEILQIALVEMNYDQNKLAWIPGRDWVFTQGSRKVPVGEFANKHMTHLYAKCNDLPFVAPETVRQKMLSFFQECGAQSPRIYFSGLNVVGFDLVFLTHHQYLSKNTRVVKDGKEEFRGDFHYRAFDLSGALVLAQSVVREADRNALIERCVNLGGHVDLPQGLKEHDALYDCYRQIKLANGLIKLLLPGTM